MQGFEIILPVSLQILRGLDGLKPSSAQSGELFRQPLIEQINAKHPLVRLAAVIDWQAIERTFGAHFASTAGRPALAPRLAARLLYLPTSMAAPA